MATRPRERSTQQEDRTDKDGAFLQQMSDGMQIDKHALDEALILQVHNFHQVSERLAIEISLRDAAKDELKVVEAEVDEVVRADAAESEKKITETAIKNAVAAHRDVIKAQKEFARLAKSVGLLQALKESYLQRSYALKELVTLYMANYFGEGSVENAGARRIKDEGAQGHRKAINEERQRRARS
jgi:hypothetical protein